VLAQLSEANITRLRMQKIFVMRLQMTKAFGSRRGPGRNIGEMAQKIAVWVCLLPVNLLYWLTDTLGGQVSLGVLMMYCFLVNVESYWQQVGNGVFVPKPFIDDGAGLLQFLPSLSRLAALPNFWLTVFFVLALNTVTSIFFRDLTVKAARKRYAEVADEKLPLSPSLTNSLDIAHLRYRQLKSAGMKGVKLAGLGAIMCITIDLTCNYSGFPWLGSPRWLILLVWWLVSTFGFEVCAAFLHRQKAAANAPANVEQ
jgi:hypothetical protein